MVCDCYDSRCGGADAEIVGLELFVYYSFASDFLDIDRVIGRI